jgi:hypothetical protein
MGKRAVHEIPAGMQEVQRRFDEWRSSHSGRRPIPDSLWAQAAELARQHGIFRTAQVLRLDYTKLKQQVRAATCEVQPARPQTAFVELVAPAVAQPCECIIEVEGPRGRMRIEWKGATAPDFAGLSRALWEPGA